MQFSRRPNRSAIVSRRSGGFTLLELLIVMALLGTMAAVSIPAFVGAIAHTKLRGASSSLAGLIQSGRMQAVKRNRTLTVHFLAKGDALFAFVSEAGNTSPDPEPTDLQVQLGGATFQLALPTGPGAPPLTADILSYTPLNLPDSISFSPRGLPCKYVSGGCSPAGFVYYVTDTGHRNAWTAVSISPGGRVKQWFWNGRVWAD